jgi:hypothetical protein
VEDVTSAVIGDAYPSPQAVGADGNRFVRHWVVRLEREVPEAEALEALVERLLSSATEALSPTPAGELAAMRLPSVRLLKIARRHCVVSIESPSHEKALGPDAAAITWTVLRGVDGALGLSDLQGIPKELWFQLK